MEKTEGDTASFQEQCHLLMSKLSKTPYRTKKDADFIHNLMTAVLEHGVVCEWDDVRYLVFGEGLKVEDAKCRGELLMIDSACGGFDIRNHSQSENAANVVIGGKELNGVQGVSPLWLLKLEQVQRAIVTTELLLDAVSAKWIKGGTFVFDFVRCNGWVIGTFREEPAGSQRHVLVASQLSLTQEGDDEER